ncbi:MAG: acetate--CoA ligase family protein [Paracoccaceae bacterium]
MADQVEDTPMLEDWPHEIRDALERLAGHRRVALAEGRGEIEIWAEAADGRRLKLGAAERAGEDAEARLVLNHVFVLSQKLADSAGALGFVPTNDASGRRAWVMDGEDACARFAEGVAALIGLRGGAATRPVRAVARPERLLAPRCLAVLGDPENDADGQAGAIVAMLEAAGFAGTVQAPGPDAAALAELSPAPEMVVVAEGVASSAGEVLAAATDVGAAAVVMLAGGAWPEPAGEAEEPAGRPVVIGPGSAGLFRAASRFVVARERALAEAVDAEARTGVVVQSAGAAQAVAAMAGARGLGLGALIDAGARPGLDVAAALRLMVDDQAVDTVLVAIERVGDGAALIDALQRARAAAKPVVVLAPGRSASGQGALGQEPDAQADAVLDAVLEQHGGVRAGGLAEAVDVARAAAAVVGGGPFPSGHRLGLADARGLAAALAADMAEAVGLVPVVTAGLRTEGVDAVIRFGDAASEAVPEGLACLDCMAGHGAAPRFDDPGEAVAAMAALMRFGTLFSTQPGRSPLATALPPLPVAADAEGHPEATATRTALAAAGIVAAEERLVRSPEAAEAVVAAAGRATLTPVSPELPGDALAEVSASGVTTGDLATLFPAVVAKAREAAPGAKLTGMLITPDAPHGPRVMVAVRRDPRFGAVVEAALPAGQRVRRVAPLAAGTAVAMAEALLAPALAYAERAESDPTAGGASGTAVAALAALIDRVAIFAAAHGEALAALTLRPVTVTREGAVIGDADLRVATGTEAEA